MLPNPTTLPRLALGAALGLASGLALADPVSPMSASQFSDAVAAEKRPLFVLFHADWVQSSQSLRTALARAAADYQGEARFVELDMNRTAEAAARYGIRGVPTLLLLDHGRRVGSRVGAASEDELRDWIDAGLDAASGSPPSAP